ncbi:MAG: hypothetical protein ABIR71_04330 [Chthoniobacterales bacterium]
MQRSALRALLLIVLLFSATATGREILGKAFIPFNFKPTPIRTGVLTFGADRKVKEFRWDAETNG